MDAPWVPPTYIDASRQVVPTDSPYTHNVGQDIFREQVPFTSSQTVRVITGPGPGMGAFGRHPAAGRQFREGADPRPIPIPAWHPVAVPHGLTEGGIFGSGAVHTAMAVGAQVPKRIDERVVVQRPGMSGVFGSPDGLGR